MNDEWWVPRGDEVKAARLTFTVEGEEPVIISPMLLLGLVADGVEERSKRRIRVEDSMNIASGVVDAVAALSHPDIAGSSQP